MGRLPGVRRRPGAGYRRMLPSTDAHKAVGGGLGGARCFLSEVVPCVWVLLHLPRRPLAPVHHTLP